MAGRKSAFGKQLQEMSPTDKNISNRQTTFCWFYVGIVFALSFPGVIKVGWTWWLSTSNHWQRWAWMNEGKVEKRSTVLRCMSREWNWEHRLSALVEGGFQRIFLIVFYICFGVKWELCDYHTCTCSAPILMYNIHQSQRICGSQHGWMRRIKAELVSKRWLLVFTVTQLIWKATWLEARAAVNLLRRNQDECQQSGGVWMKQSCCGSSHLELQYLCRFFSTDS